MGLPPVNDLAGLRYIPGFDLREHSLSARTGPLQSHLPDSRRHCTSDATSRGIRPRHRVRRHRRRTAAIAAFYGAGYCGTPKAGRGPCLVCGRSPGHAHHLRFAQPRALGRKVSDEWVVPLCATHHRALHGVGDEERWWKERGIDPIGHARILWWTTRFGKAAQPGENPAGMKENREEGFASTTTS